MTKTTSVRFTYSARGPRAWTWARGRWWPTGVEEARLAVATGAAKDATAEYVATDTPWGRRFHYQKPAEDGTCEHGFIGACGPCDGSGQTPTEE
jgi:hypothetical protein